MLIGYLVGVLGLLLIRSELFLPREWFGVVTLVIGGLLGWSLVWFDKIAYIYILHPEAQISQYVQHQVKQRRFRQAFEVIEQRAAEMDKLTTRSVLFQSAWVVLALFAITSVAGWFGKALVMCVGLRTLYDNWQEYLVDRLKLKQGLFWQVKREMSDQELKWYMYGMSGVFLWLSWLIV